MKTLNATPSTLAIAPSLLMLAIAGSQLGQPGLAFVSDYVADVRDFYTGIHGPSEDAVPVTPPIPAPFPAASYPHSDLATAAEPVDLQQFAAQSGQPESAFQLEYRDEPVIEPPASMSMPRSRRAMLRLVVNSDGTVDSVVIAQSTGLPRLDRLILKAYQKAVFYPFHFAGIHGPVIIHQNVEVSPPAPVVVAEEPGETLAEFLKRMDNSHGRQADAEPELKLTKEGFAKAMNMQPLESRDVPFRVAPVFELPPLDQPVTADFILNVDFNGNVTGVELVTSSGSNMLDSKLADFYRQAKFAPYSINRLPCHSGSNSTSSMSRNWNSHQQVF